MIKLLQTAKGELFIKICVYLEHGVYMDRVSPCQRGSGYRGLCNNQLSFLPKLYNLIGEVYLYHGEDNPCLEILVLLWMIPQPLFVLAKNIVSISLPSCQGSIPDSNIDLTACTPAHIVLLMLMDNPMHQIHVQPSGQVHSKINQCNRYRCNGIKGYASFCLFWF